LENLTTKARKIKNTKQENSVPYLFRVFVVKKVILKKHQKSFEDLEF